MSALPEPDAYAFGPFVLDRQRRSLARDGAPVSVTPKAFDLLVILVEHGGVVVSKEKLMSVLWPDTSVEEGNLTFQISTLRKALGREGAPYVATVPGRGYQFAAPLQRVGSPVAASETIVEDEERTTITVSEIRKPGWAWLVAGIVVVLLVAGILLLRDRRRPAGVSRAIRSLAVLPFKPIVAAQRDEALELGMADTLINRLSHMPGVIVRPTSAVRRYSRLDEDPLAAGRALGVDAVLDGSIQRDGSRMRVNVRLLRTNDGKPVWAGQMDAKSGDLFAVQDRVADGVARVVVPALAGPAEEHLARRVTADLQAYELYLKGRYWTYQDAERAEEFFRRAIARDPRFAAAWAAIADTWLVHGRFTNGPPQESFARARQAALKAIELDPDSAEGHAALAQVYADHDWDWKRAEAEYVRALELHPNSAVAHGQYTYLLLFRRDFDAALEHINRACEIDPLSPVWACLKGYALDCSGRNSEAVRHLEETLRLHPRLIPVLLHLGMVSTNGGNPQRGVALFREARSLGADPPQLLGLEAWALARSGDREGALRILRDLEQRSEREPIAVSNLALAWTALGDHDRAFAWLEHALRNRIFLVRTVTVHPGFAALRRDPRYPELIRRMGL